MLILAIPSIKHRMFLTHLKFENKSRALAPESSNHYLYLIKLLIISCYPGGNFDENQLLDDSISLSPL